MRVPGRRVADFGQFGSENWLPWQCPLSDRGTNIRRTKHLQPHFYQITNPEKLVKIGLVGSEISLL